MNKKEYGINVSKVPRADSGLSKKNLKVVSLTDIVTIESLNKALREEVGKVIGDEIIAKDSGKKTELTNKIEKIIIPYINSNGYEFTSPSEQSRFVKEFITNFAGYGVLQPLMDDDYIEEIFALGPDEVYFSKNGKLTLSSISFKTEDKMRTFIDNLLALINKEVNMKTPIVDGRLPDGSRLAVSDGSLSGGKSISFNIRKFRKAKIQTDDLVKYGTINKKMEKFLIKAINSYMNIVVSGGTSSGKTTLLNSIAQYLSDEDFIITLEDNLELQIDKPKWLQLEARQANLEGSGEITMFDLQKHTLRRSPNRIIIGEVRDGAVADSLYNAISTGHDGVMCTIHANDPYICRKRMSKLAASFNKQDIKESIDDFNNTFDIIVQIKRFKSKNRRIITNVTFVSSSGELIDLFKYDKDHDIWVEQAIPQELTDRMEYNS